MKSLVLAVMGLLCSMSVNAHDFKVDGIYYNITSSTNKTVAVTYQANYYNSYSNEYSGDVKIPESVTYNGNTYSVTSIGSSAFRECSRLTSVEIPNSVTSIGSEAFYGTAWYNNQPDGVIYAGKVLYKYKGTMTANTSITIEDGTVSISPYAFYDCDGLTSVEIGNSVASIGSYAFWGCDGLTSVVIPNNVTSIGTYAFQYCYNLKVVLNNSSFTFAKGSSNYGYIACYAEVVCNGWYEQVDDFIFTEEDGACSLRLYVGNETELVLPANYKGGNYGIGEYAFIGCSALTSLTIGAGVLSIGSNQCTPKKTIWLTNTPPSGWTKLRGTINYVANELYGSSSDIKVYPYLSSMFETNGIKYVPISPSERTCDAIDCNYDSAVEDINIGETVSYRGIAMTVKNVMPYVAYGQKTVKQLSVSHKGDIGAFAFYGCTALTNAAISNKGNIGDKAFYGCTAITNATISNKGNIGTSAFEGAMKSANATINVASTGYIERKAFYGCTGIKTAVIDLSNDTKKNITLEDWTSPYTGNYNTSSKTYNFTLQQSGTLSFDWWVSSESGRDKLIVVLDGSTVLTKSGEDSGTFSQSVSAGIHTLVVKYTKDGIFYSGQDKASVYNIKIEGGVYDISPEAFRGCTSLASLTLGDSIQYIGASAFRECSSLTEVKIPNLVTRLGDYCFASTTALKHVELCDSLQGIGTSCFSGSGLESISIPASVKNIGDYAFDDCTKLADVVIEDRTADLLLGSNGSSPLFADCPLDSVYIGGNISYNTSSSYGYSPFYRNTSLRAVVISDKEEEISDNEFYGCTNLKNVTIGSDVKKIGNWAFSGCSNLDYFSFGKSVETIGQEAFSDCVNLTKLISYAEVPPTCGTMALDDINKWNCVLQVPQSCLAAYQQANQWKEFFFIEDVLTAIGGVTVDGTVPATADVYSTNGMLIKRNAELKNLHNELPAGIYIIGGKKVWVK